MDVVDVLRDPKATINVSLDNSGKSVDVQYISENSPKGAVVKFNHEASVSLRRLTDFRPSTMTFITILEGKIISRANLFYCLPCISQQKWNKGVKYPAGTIVSCRWKNMNKGYAIKWFKHSINVNIWTSTKEMMTKITRKSNMVGDPVLDAHKIQMTGIFSKDLAEETSHWIVEAMKSAVDFYMYVQANATAFIEVVAMLASVSHGKHTTVYKQMTVYDTQSIVDNNAIVMVESFDEIEFSPPNIEDIGEQYREIVKEILLRFSDIVYVSELMPRALAIVNKPQPCEETIGINSVRRSMVNYNYTLGFSINRYELLKVLTELGYQAYYFNDMQSYVAVYSDNIYLGDRDEILRRPNKPDNGLKFYCGGEVKHSGTGGIAMEHIYMQIMLDIIENHERIAK